MWWACRLSVFKIQVQCVLICLQIWNAEESHGTSFILWMWRLKTFCLIEILECYHDFRIRRFQEVITKATWPAVTCNISLFSSKNPHVPHMQLPVGTLCFSIQQPHLGEKGLCLGFVDILLQKQVGTSWNSHYVLSMLRLPISAYAVCVTHPQMLDLSTGAPGGECANTAISNMTNIYHMYFVFSPLFFGREGPHVLAGTISALFACKNTSSRNCISHRKQKVVMFAMAMSPWGSSLPILGCGLSPALSFCRILFTWGTRLPVGCLAWRSGGWGVPGPAIWPSCYDVQNLQWEKENYSSLLF